MTAHPGDHISLGMQFVASFCWVAGALFMGLGSTADYFHFAAALAWCVANFAAAWSVGWLDCFLGGEREIKSPSLFLSFRRLLTGASDAPAPAGAGDARGGVEPGAAERA
tara:strand:- start:192 stop:521 length:330 start_codon:yes stop_codon:yes gene_type:complete